MCALRILLSSKFLKTTQCYAPEPNNKSAPIKYSSIQNRTRPVGACTEESRVDCRAFQTAPEGKIGVVQVVRVAVADYETSGRRNMTNPGGSLAGEQSVSVAKPFASLISDFHYKLAHWSVMLSVQSVTGKSIN
jgi:hypothetical protein